MSSSEGNYSSERSPSKLQVGLVGLAILVLLYSFLVMAQPILGVSVVLWLFGIYLLWRFLRLAARFVRAVERIADALERRDGEW